jgi:hypothetical protein
MTTIVERPDPKGLSTFSLRAESVHTGDSNQDLGDRNQKSRQASQSLPYSSWQRLSACLYCMHYVEMVGKNSKNHINKHVDEHFVLFFTLDQ